MSEYPRHYLSFRKRYKGFFSALEGLGSAASASGPIEEKTAHLIQMAAAAAMRSEGAVHSHARRALKAGASKEELYHALILLTSTIGFPQVAASVSWIDDLFKRKR
jgi:AhpD family alkylhydroperoxidase